MIAVRSATVVCGYLAVVSVAVWVVGAGCAVENGTGTLHGIVNVPVCTLPGGQAQPLAGGNPYDQTWHFFVGEPFDSTTARFPANQLNIRMQRSSARWEFADALTFWVLDAYEAARCMRGRLKPDGTDDWDPLMCDRSAGPEGEGRLLIGTEGETVNSHFLLHDSCPDVLISADALGSCAGGTCPLKLCPGHGSWIAFSKFGAPPSKLMDELPRDFKVNNGERIEASAFHVELCDDSTIEAQREFLVPVPTPAITGTLDGAFSFVLQP